MEYIVVQAGGKGTRLEHLTRNKPKALVPVENLPMLFHLFRKYPDKRFVIIADYKKDVLRAYLSAFANVKYQVVDAIGSGTASGLKQALSLIPEKAPFMLLWSDLILPEGFEVPQEYSDADNAVPERDYIGISKTFPCRWSYANGKFDEERSTEHGVAGFFLFREKAVLSEVPDSGELVRWMQSQSLTFDEVSLAGTREFGILEEYERLEVEKCRPFNKITIEDGVLTKVPLDQQGETLAKREEKWYAKAQEMKISGIPELYGTNPLRMEVIRGKNIYEYSLTKTEKRRVLEQLVAILNTLHSTPAVAADSFSIKEAYFNKTIQRLSQIEDLVPFARERYIRINGKNCRNVFFFRDRLERRLEQLTCDKFHFIHGDCTFSNMMLRENGEPVLIDPRGYFGFTENYGDVRYDWAKLYYSVVGNYDRFNLKKFRMQILDDEVNLQIESNGWEDMEEDFFALTEADPDEIRLLHAVIWLSLTTYAWQDYDSICAAFYNGLYYLEDVL